ncbi:hypothetical protein [Pseudomonas sp. dw_612]|uniref:hypothetical protein n=1 Tax=Pseudomonas sp. dw_612 TaxID=2720080 RepID=UPI001BD4B6A1|nr:hypothetical protein [Pseudomonas sp. dw_612]
MIDPDPLAQKKMLKINTEMAMLIAMLACAGQALGAGLPSPTVDVLAWPRMSSSEFGCYMEQSLGHRDKRFNCSLMGYENQGDPCSNVDTYTEGPELPASLAARIHPLATQVQLSWEHGELQQVTLLLKGTLNEAEVRNAFKLPRAEAYLLSETELGTLPENIMDTSVQYESTQDSPGTGPSDSSSGVTSVMLTGFDHMGAGDVECRAEE